MSKNTNLSFLTDYITADITNGRIGINNASPAYAFDVTGIARTSTSTYLATASGNVGIGTTSPLVATGYTSISINNATNGGILDLQQNGTSVMRVGNNGTTVAFIETRTATPLTFSTNDAERMRITSAGNVGVGTTAPDTSLHVLGSTNRPIIISTSNATTVYTTYRYNTSTDVGYIGNGTGVSSTGSSNDFGVQAVNNLIFAAGGGTERMRITNAGQVLINATSSTYGPSSGYNFGVRGTTSQAFISIAKSNQTLDSQGMLIGLDGTGGYLYMFDNAPILFVTNNAERGRITGGGNWLLGTATDNGERLYVSGAIRATGTITANSDINLKKNLLKIENALEKVEQINGYTYEFKADDSKRHAGVIAQEIQTVLPEIVNKGNDGILGVEYGNISALLIEAIKELSAEITILKNK